MKIKSLIAALVLASAFTVQASVSILDNAINLDQAHNLISQEIGADQTCVDEFLEREKYLKKFLIWAPPIATVATPVAAYAGGFAAAGLSTAAGVGGWNVLGWTIAGVFGAGGATLGTFVFLEVTKGIEFSNNRYMIRLVSAAHIGDMQNKKIRNFIKRYRSKFANDAHLSDEDIVQEIVDLDKSQALCDGTVTGNTKKFKKKLSRRRHALRYIHDTLGRP